MADTPSYGRGQVIEIISAVIDKMDAATQNREVLAHMAELAKMIDALKQDIASYQPEHVKNSHIPNATDELDAVVAATEEATNRIMTMCEEIGEIASGFDPEKRALIEARIGHIYEACSFQDITGQRIRNVVGTLHLIESKVEQIMNALGEKMGLSPSDGKFERKISAKDDKSLLNGPQLPAKAITQDDIDRLLADFDRQ